APATAPDGDGTAVPPGPGLVVRTTAVNVGDRPCPFGAGQHPYLTAGTPLIDDCTVHLDAATWLRTDDRGLPAGREPVDGTPMDFRTPRRLGGTSIDNAFTGLG